MASENKAGSNEPRNGGSLQKLENVKKSNIPYSFQKGQLIAMLLKF